MAELAAYPSVLPMPLQSSQQVKTVSPLVRTEMASGRARQRRAFTSTPQTVSVSFIMPNAKGALFEGWYRYGITDGADWFTAPLRTPMGIKQVEMRFTDIYSGPDPVGFLSVQYSGTVELRYRQTPTELETANMLAGGDLHEIVQELDMTARQWYTRSWEDADA